MTVFRHGLLALVGLLAVSLAAGVAEDWVYVSGRNSTSGHTKFGGRIVDYTGEFLQLELPTGRMQTFPAERISRIQTQHVPQQPEADALFAKGQYNRSLALYRQAVGSERRTWVRREIIAQMVRCSSALGRWDEAGNLFLTLLASSVLVLIEGGKSLMYL